MTRFKINRPPAKRTLDTIQPEAYIEEPEWKSMEPLSEATVLCDTFSLSTVPSKVKPLVRVISSQGNTDAGYAAASIIVFISGGLSNLYKVEPERGNTGWHIPPNLSGLLVGPASVQKSRGYRPIESLVRKAEDKLLDEFAKSENEEIAAFDLQKKLNYSREKLAEKIISESILIKSKDTAKSEELVAEAKGILMQIERDLEFPSPMLLIINDTTEAGLHKLKTKEMHCHYLVRDELAALFLNIMSRGQAKIKAFLIEAMDGDNDYRRNLKTELAGKALAPRISILGTIQPSKIEPFLKDAREDGFSNDGFFNRLQLLIYPDEKAVLKLPGKSSPEAVKLFFESVFIELLSKNNLLTEKQKVINFSQDAQPTFDKFKEKIELKLTEYVGTPMQSHIGKYTGLVPSIALVFEFLSKLSDEEKCPVISEISLPNLKKAIEWADYLESHARKVFGLEDPNLAIAKQILNLREELGQIFTVRDVYSKLRKPYYRNKGLTVDSLQYLETLGYVRELPKSTSSKGGAPKQEWQFNPVLFKS